MVVKLIENLDEVTVQVSPASLGVLEVMFQGKLEEAPRLTRPFSAGLVVALNLAVVVSVVVNAGLTVSIPLPPHDHFLGAVLKEVPGSSR